MKILYLAHRVPYPPNKGDKIRSFHEIRYFSRHHDIHLLAFCDRPGDQQFADKLKQYCSRVTLVPLNPWRQRFRAATFMLCGKPWTLGYYASAKMREALAEEIQGYSFDLIFVYCSSMAPYVKSLKGVPRILDFVDSDASKWQQYADAKSVPYKWLYRYEGKSLVQFETDAIADFDFSVFVSRRETEHLSGCVNSQKVSFVQNGVDLDYFSAIPRNGSRKTIIFTGAMDYYPNIDAVSYFVREVLPIVREAVADARFLIVGSNPSRHVQALASEPGVTVTGAVKDVRPFLADADVAVVPIKISQGIQNKILEAIASGLPVVATKAALDGMTSTKGLPLAEANDAPSFAEHVIRYMNYPLSAIQVEAGRRALKINYHWDTNLAAFDRLFEQLVPLHP